MRNNGLLVEQIEQLRAIQRDLDLELISKAE
jgi:hypothetical protein